MGGIDAARFAKYLVTGGSAALVDFGMFKLCLAILSFAHDGALSSTTVANSLGILTGFLWAFFLQKFWAFKSRGPALPQMLATAALLTFNIVVTSLAIPWLASTFGIGVSWAKIFMQVAVVVWNYAILNKLVFKAAGSSHEA